MDTFPTILARGVAQTLHQFGEEKDTQDERYKDGEELSKQIGAGKESPGSAQNGDHVLTLFTFGELILLLLSFPFPVNCSFTVTSCQKTYTGKTHIRDTPPKQ